MSTGEGASSTSVADQAGRSLRHPLTLTLFALTFSTGTVDAVSYLRLGRVFTANMTGNVVLLGFGIAHMRGLPVAAPIISTLSFLIGGGFGGLLARRLGDRHTSHVAAALSLEGVLLAAATLLSILTRLQPGGSAAYIAIVLMAGAMGIRNSTTRHLAVPDLTTTVLTMTLTGLSAESVLSGGSGHGTTRRVLAISIMLAGAVAGALMLQVGVTLPLAFSAGLALLLWPAYLAAGR